MKLIVYDALTTLCDLICTLPSYLIPQLSNMMNICINLENDLHKIPHRLLSHFICSKLCVCVLFPKNNCDIWYLSKNKEVNLINQQG